MAVAVNAYLNGEMYSNTAKYTEMEFGFTYKPPIIIKGTMKEGLIAIASSKLSTKVERMKPNPLPVK